MEKAIEHLKHELRTVRTGRASPSVPEATQLLIKPFSPSDLKAIEKAVNDSKLGLTPHSDGKSLRLMLPPMSQERRVQLAGQCKQYAEAAKISVRNARRDANK